MAPPKPSPPAPACASARWVDANDYKLTTAGEYANYEYVDASYSGLGEGNVLTATPGGKVVLTYKYAEINVQVIHRYPGLSDVKTYDEEHYLNSTLTVADVAEPVTYYNGVLYAVSGTAVTVGGSAVTPSEGQISLTGDAVITITYEVANSGFHSRALLREARRHRL